MAPIRADGGGGRGRLGLDRRRRSLCGHGKRAIRSDGGSRARMTKENVITQLDRRAEPSESSRQRDAAARLLGFVRRDHDQSPVAEQLVSLTAPGSFAADQYRTLRHSLERLRKDSRFQVL